MASKRTMTVWQLLARLGHRGDREDRENIIQHVFEATSRVALRSDGGEPLDGGDYLVEVFESLGTTRDWPPCGGREWTCLREVAVRRILARLAREGLLDAVSVGRSGRAGSGAEPRGRGGRGPRAAPGGRGPRGESADERGGGVEAAGGDGLPGAARPGLRGRPHGGGHGGHRCRGDHPLRGRKRETPGAGLAGAGAVAGAGRRPAGREAGGGGATGRGQAGGEGRPGRRRGVKGPSQRAAAGPASCPPGRAAPNRSRRSARSSSGVW
jgi:hypothetical protein